MESNKKGLFNQSRISDLDASEAPSKLTRLFANSQLSGASQSVTPRKQRVQIQ
jgi:hypothetical protein